MGAGRTIPAGLAFLLLAATTSAQVAGPDGMAKGMNFIRVSSAFSYSSIPARQSLSRLKDSCSVNWVAIVPVWWMSDTGSSSIFWMLDMSPSDAEVRDVIRQARRRGLKVLLKPEVHCVSGVWSGEHDPHDEAWFHSYRSFLERYAGIAQQEQCALFCIGTALDRSADEQWETAQWRSLIQAAKGLYNGPIVYAADWRTYRSIEFWDELDYVGINAGFPLWNDATPWPEPEYPSVACLARQWKTTWLPEIEAFRRTLADTLKPVLFTEVGYRSVVGASRRPWDRELSGEYSPTEQRNCYMAVLHSLLGRPWFAGWFWTGWTTDPEQGGPGDTSYTPKGKPAETVLRHWNRAIGTHRAATVFYHLLGPNDFYLRAGPTLDSLVADHANWVAISPWWFMADTNAGWDTIAPDPYYSPGDEAMRTAIRLARARGLRVMLAPHVLALQDGTWIWTNQFNPGSLPGNGLRKWFHDYRNFIVHYAAFAEEESCDLLSVGNELNHTTNDPAEVALWRDSVVPAVRAVYSGPLTYNAYWGFLDDRNNGPHEAVDSSFWAVLDFCGINAYFQLYPKEGFPSDTTWNQTPEVEDIARGVSPYNPLAWEQKWLPKLESLYRAIQRPVLFTEVGFGSFDSTAWYTSGQPGFGWSRMSVGCTLDLYSVCFPVDTMTGYAVGAGGTILKTANVGTSWQSIPSGTANDLFAVHFPVRDTGYAVGEQGTILKIVPGSVGVVDWQPPTTVSCFGVHFPGGPQTGFVVGFRESAPAGVGLILKTTDGGGSWSRYSWPPGQEVTDSLRAVHFPSAACGYVVGNNGVILKTTDAGASWRRLDAGPTVDLRGVFFRSPDTGYVVGDSGFFMMTGDGAETWILDRATDRTWPVPFNAVGFPVGDSETTTPVPVYAVGDYGRILRVEELNSDLPLNRFHQRSLPCGIGHLRSVCFPSGRRTGFAVGDKGTILRTRRGGRLTIDFNEQVNCYEATFRAFWGDQLRPEPRPWFYGFYWWYYHVSATPRETEFEEWLSSMTPQQKPAGRVLRGWFAAPFE
uniref:Photosynthesis system II assembly factor Ycf48/Hcf136-like domain-containing protein n=1 Tax=candidate division WOR-3 bacterium TaxID=2052148 RepID=A0A7C4GDY9_UNCW3